jgi:hypothetical protein
MPRFMSRGSATPVDDYKESRMKLVDPTNLTGHPLFAARPTLPDTTLSFLPSTSVRSPG